MLISFLVASEFEAVGHEAVKLEARSDKHNSKVPKPAARSESKRRGKNSIQGMLCEEEEEEEKGIRCLRKPRC